MSEIFKELYETIRIDIITQMNEGNVSIDEIAEEMEISVDELCEYLSLEKTDYLVYKKIYGIVKKKTKKDN